jgi:hypothetical protein
MTFEFPSGIHVGASDGDVVEADGAGEDFAGVDLAEDDLVDGPAARP